MNVTIEDLQEDLPVGGDVDVFLIDVVVQKHCTWILPCLLPETEPEHTHTHTQKGLSTGTVYQLFVTHSFEKVTFYDS